MKFPEDFIDIILVAVLVYYCINLPATRAWGTLSEVFC